MTRSNLEIEFNQPKAHDALWLTLGFGLLIGIWFASLLAGKSGIIWFLGLVIVAALIAVIVTSGSPAVGMARFVAPVLLVVLICLMVVTGVPLLIAELLSPIAQSLQDGGGDLGITINFGWVILMIVIWVVLVVVAGRLYISHSVPEVVLSAFVAAVALFPLVGMIAQEKLKNG